VDVEMSFITEDDIMTLTEELFTRLTAELCPDARVITPFPRFSFKEAMERFGCDKPDIRFGMEIGDVSDIVASRSSASLARRWPRAAWYAALPCPAAPVTRAASWPTLPV
jgi:aspartyl-tRNA synthetase